MHDVFNENQESTQNDGMHTELTEGVHHLRVKETNTERPCEASIGNSIGIKLLVELFTHQRKCRKLSGEDDGSKE